MSAMRAIPIAMLAFCALTMGRAAAGPLEDQVNAAYSNWDAAFDKGDAKALAAFYADDAVFLPATHDVVKGSAGASDDLRISCNAPSRAFVDFRSKDTN